MRNIQQFQKTVIDHWRKYGRHNLPWRHTRDPYAILVSEVMLQQTQVDRVVPYFMRWMKTFPTSGKLAKAPLSHVLKEWSGLGYNRRAKMLHECARAIVREHDGLVPRDASALRALPGVGPYTASAVRVFAFNQPDTLLETNVRTVFLHHFFPHVADVPDTALEPLLQKAARGHDPRTWHSALMDYGSHLKKTHPNPSRRSKHHTRQKKFEGSLRQMRGAILRARITGASLASLKRAAPARFAQALHSLRQEGLVR